MTAGAWVLPPRALPVLFVLLWSTGFIGARLGKPYIEPMTFLSVRFALVIALLAVAVAVARSPLPRGRGILHCAVVGVLVHAAYLGGVFQAITWQMPAGVAALIVSCQPLLTALVAGPLFGERLRLTQWLGIALGFVGVALVVGPGLVASGVAGFDLRAEAVGVAVVALFAITIGTLYQKRFAGEQPIRGGALVQYIAALLVLLPLSFAAETQQVTWTGELVFAMAWLVLVLSIGAIFLLMAIIRRGTVTNTASLFYLVPPMTTLIAWLLFDEQLGWIGLMGMIVAAAGVALVNRKPIPAGPSKSS